MWVHYEWLKNGFLSLYKLVLNLSKYLTKFCSINKPIVLIILNVIIVPILVKVSITVIKYYWKIFGETKAYFILHFHITVHHEGKSRYQIGHESRSSNWNKCCGGFLLLTLNQEGSPKGAMSLLAGSKQSLPEKRWLPRSCSWVCPCLSRILFFLKLSQALYGNYCPTLVKFVNRDCVFFIVVVSRPPRPK